MQCLQPDTHSNECLKESLMIHSYGGTINLKGTLKQYEEFSSKLANAEADAIKQFLSDNPEYDLLPF